MYLRLLLAPLVGGVIGYLTNSLAIKMLFRPRKALYIGKWRLPFTPGLIPKQKERIAASIGRVISTQLLDAGAVRKAVLSEEAQKRVGDKIRSFLDRYQEDGRTVRQALERYLEPEKIDLYQTSIREQAAQLLMEELQQEEVGKKIVQYGMDALQEKMKEQMGRFGNFLHGAFLKSMEADLENKVDSIISEKAPGVIRTEIDKVEEKCLDMTLGEIYDSQRESIPQLVEGAMALYQSAVEHNLEKILALFQR